MTKEITIQAVAGQSVMVKAPDREHITLSYDRGRTWIRATVSGTYVEPPTPSARPFALPVTTRTVTIPGSIDHTGATDVTAALQAFIDGTPDGSIITAASGSVYKTSQWLNLQGRNHLLLDLAGVTIHSVAVASGMADMGLRGSIFGWHWVGTKPTHITVKGATVSGANPSPGVLGSGEAATCLYAMGGQYIELDGVTTSGLYGDGLLTANENPSDIWVHGSHVINCGRSHVSVVCGSRVLVEDNRLDQAGYSVIDIEPEPGSIAGASAITFRRNVCGSWHNSFVSVDGVNAGKAISDVTIEDNTVSAGSLLSVIGGSAARVQRLSFQRNAGTGSASVAVRHTDGVTFRGNTGATLSATDCTSVVTA